MKRKKILIAAYIITIIIIAIIMINRIFAASLSDVGEVFKGDTKYGWYKVDLTDVKTDGDNEYEIEDLQDLTRDELISHGVYLDDLDNNFYWFCTQISKPIPHKAEKGRIYRLNKNDNMAIAFFNAYKADDWIAEFSSGDDEIELTEKPSSSYLYLSRDIDYSNAQIEEKTTQNIGRGGIDWNKAYILAVTKDDVRDDNNSFYETIYQQALWRILREDGYSGNQSEEALNPMTEEAKEIYNKAKAFGIYKEKLLKERKAKYPNLDENKLDMPVLNNGNENNYTFKYNSKGDYFIAGPINIDYGDLTATSGNQTIDVKKITALELKGTNIKGEEVDITKFYFSDKDGNNEKEGTIANFPNSNEDFYIKVKNDPMYKELRTIDSFKAKFETLDVEARAYEVRGINVYYTEWKPSAGGKGRITVDSEQENDDYFWDYECVGTCVEEYKDGTKVYHYDGCTRSDWLYADWDQLEKITHTYSKGVTGLKRGAEGQYYNHEAQRLWLVSNARLFWKEYELEIGFEPNLDGYVDIGGKVWIDMPTGDKTNDEDGIYKEGSNDYGRKNVKVKLYFEDGTEVRLGTNTLKNGEKVEIIKDDKNKLCDSKNGVQYYETYTDTNGDYVFYYLPAGHQYYVEFEYDGSEYEIVEYLAGGTEASYLSNPNSSVYDNNSKVKEEIDRQAFINKFKTIRYTALGKGATNKITEGTRVDNSNKAESDLKYFTNTYVENRNTYVRSKILTTTGVNDSNFKTNPTGLEYSKQDVDRDKKEGQALEPHVMKARTAKIYPLDSSFTIWSVKNADELKYLKHINLGLKVRPKSDLALQTQLKAGAMTIKDKEKIVFYKTSATDDELEIDGTNTENEYVKQEIAASDYNWKANYEDIYGDNGNITGYIVDEDKLNVYVLYRIVIQNQCAGINETGIIHELVDYYDNRLELVPEKDREKVKDLFGSAGLNVPNRISSTSNNKYNLSWIEGDTKLVTWTTKSRSGNYNTMLAENLDLQIDSDNTSAIYLILKVKENEDVLYTGTDNEEDGIQNIAEITSYSIYNANTNEYVGKIDKDSAPGNAKPGDNSTYEDDTDAAPIFRLEINWAPRKITGNVWDDLDKDGNLDEIGKGIKNVTVKLIEYILDESGEVKEVERPGLILDEVNKRVYTNSNSVLTDKNGNYTINVEGGNYALKFVYGNTEMLYGNDANKKYNGQDYQSTQPYKALSSGDVNGYNSDNAFPTVEAFKNAAIENMLVVGDNTNGLDLSQKGVQPDAETTKWGINTENYVSSARDIAEIRADIIRNASQITYENGNKLIELSGNGSVSSKDVAQFLSGDDNENTNYTYMEAVTDIITIASNDLVKTSKVINLGLKERPKVDVTLQKEVKRIVLKTSDGRTLIDTDDKTKLSNLQKLGDLEHEIDSTLINMDTVLMDGATLDIDYEMTVKTTGQRDSLNNYISIDSDRTVMDNLRQELNRELNGVGEDELRAEVFDYVSINLDFREDNNTTVTWTKVYDEDAGKTTLGIPLSAEAQAVLPKAQKIVSQVLQTTTKDLRTSGESITIPIHLGITLSENTTTSDLNDFDFANSAEIVKVYSGIGRRQYETVPGNYVPYSDDNLENDSDITGTTTITPPLGQQRVYYVIAIVSATILIAGIIVIKKKVLKK